MSLWRIKPSNDIYSHLNGIPERFFFTKAFFKFHHTCSLGDPVRKAELSVLEAEIAVHLGCVHGHFLPFFFPERVFGGVQGRPGPSRAVQTRSGEYLA